MNKSKNSIIIFSISLVAMGLSFFATRYFSEIYIQIAIIVILSLVLSLIISSLKKDGKRDRVLDYISQINKLDFEIKGDENLSEEAKNKIYDVYKEIRNNLKTQVEISTEIFNVVEELSVSTKESLNSSELISSSVDIAENNISEQSEMLKQTNKLAEKISQSMERIEKDVNDKIQFISNSITSAQSSIKSIDDIEERIKNTKVMVGDTSDKIVNLRNYFDQVVGFVDLINTISNQTKMLSLNASIEAARAGENGKGFSIVAMEVGKLASETESVSKKIEETIKNLKREIERISKSMEEEMNYMEENTIVIEKSSKEFEAIVDTLNLGKESLEDIKEHTSENTRLIEDINTNVSKISHFAEETTSQMAATNEQAIDQHKRCVDTDSIAEVIRGHVYNMQQFVVGKAMEDNMIDKANSLKDYFMKNKNVSKSDLNKIMKDISVDAIYVTDSDGVVDNTTEPSAVGLNLYKADPSFLDFIRSNKEYIVTPIKKRVEDGRLFKFLVVKDNNGRLYQIGVALDSIIKEYK